MKRVIALVMSVAAVLGFGVHTATADYPVGTPIVTTSSASPDTGAAITITASGWCSGASVVFTSGGVTLGSATATAAGVASITVTAPNTPGAFVVSATSSGACVASATVTMTVLARSGLPATGSTTTLSGVRLGAFAFAAGLALIGVAAFRRRRVAS